MAYATASHKPLGGIRLLLWGLSLYRLLLSPDHGPLRVFFPSGVCRFEPTCSVYASQALHRWQWRGVGFVLRRIGRCHPLTRGGWDPVPDRLDQLTSESGKAGAGFTG